MLNAWRFGSMGRMKALAQLGGNLGAMVAGGIAVAALALGAYIGLGGVGQQPAVVSAPVVQAIPQMADPDLADPELADPELAGAGPPTSAPDTQAALQEAVLDELRRERDGTSVIAGRAPPASAVRILLDGVLVAETVADSAGEFAAIALLPPSASAQILTLTSERDGTVTAAAGEIILAPQPLGVGPLGAGPLGVGPLGVGPAETDQPVEEVMARTTPEAVSDRPLVPVGEAEAEPNSGHVAILRSDASGVSLLNPAPPSAMTAIALDTIGYSALGDVQLSGRAQPDTQTVRVYLDNRSVISLPVDTDGRWRGDLPDVDAGVYTLRVDAVSAQGTVSSRVETPFQRESGAVLAQAAAGEGPVRSVTVQTGATLWAIARDRYGDGTLYLRVFEANATSIRDPDLIYPGQVFDLPD